MYELAKCHNVLESNTFRYKHFQFYQSDGTKISRAITDKLCDLFFAIQKDYTDEMDAYNGAFGNFVIEKYEILYKIIFPFYIKLDFDH